MRLARCVTWLVVVSILFAACSRVQPHVALPELSLGEPSFFPTLEAYAAAPIVGGNRVDVLLNGEQIFPAHLAAIRSAKRTISYAQYYFEDGPVSREIAEALAERCRSGVGANILLDSFGALYVPTELVDVMKNAGCHVAWFRPLKRFALPGGKANNRNHRRILVADGLVGITGGSGVSRKWMGDGRTPDHWRDTDIRVEGPAVQYIQGAFAENWLETTGIVLGGEPYFPPPTPKGQVYVQIVRSSPAGGSFAIYTALLLAISSARRSVYITNPYFVLDDKMTEAILTARGNGARVVVLVPGMIDHNIVRQASRASFGKLLQAGVEIHEYRAALLHAKTMVIDGVWATVGSTNLDNRSFALNDELNTIAYSPAVAKRMEEIFREDLAHAAPVTYETWSNRGFTQRFLELLAIPIRDQL
jgi:cardiolipin synthase